MEKSLARGGNRNCRNPSRQNQVWPAVPVDDASRQNNPWARQGRTPAQSTKCAFKDFPSTGICDSVAIVSKVLSRSGFRAFAGTDASAQPADVPDVLVHETAVAWIRTYLRMHPFSRTGSLDVQEEALRNVMVECTWYINTNGCVNERRHRFSFKPCALRWVRILT